MKKTRKIKIIKIIIMVLGLLYIGHMAPRSLVWASVKMKFFDATKNLDIRGGDFVFQHLPGELLQVIADVSESPYSHCGMIVKKDKEFYVLEAIGPVRLTPLNEWIHRGVGSWVTVVRLKDEYRSEIPGIIKAGYAYLGRPYDIQYEWDDEKIYCSELIYKAVRDATGMKLAQFRRLGDMRWESHEAFIREVAGGILPLNRKMITPGDLVKSEKVEIVYTDFSEGKK